MEEWPIPRVRLIKSTIDNLPVLENDTVYWDAGLPGFGVKVTPKGRKVFLVMYRLAGAGSRLRKYTIGPYGRVTLPMAKAQAQKICGPPIRSSTLKTYGIRSDLGFTVQTVATQETRVPGDNQLATIAGNATHASLRAASMRSVSS